MQIQSDISVSGRPQPPVKVGLPLVLLVLLLGTTSELSAQTGWESQDNKPGKVNLAPPRRISTTPAKRSASQQRIAFQTNPGSKRPGNLKPAFVPPEPENSAVSGGSQQSEKYILDQVDPSRILDLKVGRPTIVRLRKAPFRDQVANPDIIDVLNITDTEFSVSGKTVGTTVLNFWFENPAAPGGRDLLSYMVRVTADYTEVLKELELSINRIFPNSAVRLTYVGNQVVVRGQAKDVAQGAQILNIVARSVPNNNRGTQTFNFENNFIGDANSEELIEAGGINAVLQGQSNSGTNTSRINNRIVNMLEIGGIQQVMLKVTVAEVNRSAVRAIGADLRIGGGSTNFFSILPIAELGVTGTGGTLLVNRGDFDLALNALKQLNLARSLAEPNLTTLNGQQANFQVGGEFPVPQITGFTGAGLQGVQFVPYGVQLNFLPNITDSDRIRLNLQAEVSTQTDSTTDINGANITGLNTRNFQTTVELREGQTIAIAGLIQTGLTAKSDRVPFLGDIPYFGRLFASDQNSYSEQELIVLVTPYLVNPIEAECEPLPLPGSDYFEPDDLEFFIRGSLTGHFSEDFRSPARTDMKQMKAFRRLEQELIIGQPGHSNGLLCPSVEMKVHP
ncbi:Type II secretion system protein D precursor [Gimesia maris]|uniref:type II and III secretion system protein family protein n=1 Tax=Gimesia maris TaxID=122 RepID=UPI00118C9EAC|nr:pilus assembly protein N-terminal domain-containing protein [Gimesia maris]QDU16197.1 Type II secretion system protein D precursor [Gimesia maris]